MRRLVTTIPNTEGAARAFEAGARRTAFWHENHQALLEQYPEHFVAVAAGEVIAAAVDLDELLGLLKTKGFEPQQVWVEFITNDPRRVMP